MGLGVDGSASNDSGNLIHETDGKNLSEFNKYYFEQTFGPLEQYEVKLVTKDVPFPFRAWFSAAVGVPVGVVLLFAFIIKAYLAFFYNEEKKPREEDEFGPELADTKFERVIGMVSRFNIFVIGFLVFMAVFAYWVIPDMIRYLGQVGIDTLTRYKWVFLGAAVVALGLVIWVIYLRYLLAKKAMENRVELEKVRMELEYTRNAETAPLLDYREEEGETPSLVILEPEKESGKDDKHGEQS